MHDHDTLIEKKLDGTLSTEEHRWFEHLLAVDPGFGQSYQNQRSMIRGFRQHQKETLHRQLKAGYQAYQKQRTAQWYYYGAAVAMLLVLVGGWFWWSASRGALFASYYQPYEVIIPRGGSPVPTNQAAIYYSQGKYAQALPLLRRQQQTGEDPDYWTLLRGNAYLLLDSIALAKAQFQRVAASPEAEYQAYGKWYLALSYLKDNNRATARATLQSIAHQPGLFQQPARQLLDEL